MFKVSDKHTRPSVKYLIIYVVVLFSTFQSLLSTKISYILKNSKIQRTRGVKELIMTIYFPAKKYTYTISSLMQSKLGDRNRNQESITKQKYPLLPNFHTCSCKYNELWRLTRNHSVKRPIARELYELFSFQPLFQKMSTFFGTGFI